jgi:hypothetical protein
MYEPSGIPSRGTEKTPSETAPANEMLDVQSSGFTQVVGDAITVTVDPELKVPVTTGVTAFEYVCALCVAVIGWKDAVVDP